MPIPLLFLAVFSGCCLCKPNSSLYDDVAEATIRKQISVLQEPLIESTKLANIRKEGHIYISFGQGPNSDPSASFMARFSGEPTPDIRSKSQYRSDGIVVNPKTGWPGSILQIDRVTCISKTKAEVQYTMIDWQNYSMGFLSKLSKAQTGWLVTNTTVLWNTHPEDKRLE